VVLKNDLQAATKKARIFSTTSQQINLHVHPSKKQFSTTAQNKDIGETVDTIESTLSGNDLDINFNLTYLTECIPFITTESISLQFSGLGKPLVIRGVGDQSFTYLVMPLNR
jgi:DNA polymerase-3 subunit beta